MTIHFAAARCAVTSPVARVLRRPPVGSPANDDDGARHDGATLYEALVHFARHGLGAADRACALAKAEKAAGNGAGHARWLDICAIFDRRMAAQEANAPGP